MTTRRRTFLRRLAAIVVAPAAVVRRIVPVARPAGLVSGAALRTVALTPVVDVMKATYSSSDYVFAGIDRGVAPRGLAAWLPATPAGRLAELEAMQAAGFFGTDRTPRSWPCPQCGGESTLAMLLDGTRLRACSCVRCEAFEPIDDSDDEAERCDRCGEYDYDCMCDDLPTCTADEVRARAG